MLAGEAGPKLAAVVPQCSQTDNYSHYLLVATNGAPYCSLPKRGSGSHRVFTPPRFLQPSVPQLFWLPKTHSRVSRYDSPTANLSGTEYLGSGRAAFTKSAFTASVRVRAMAGPLRWEDLHSSLFTFPRQ